MTDLSRSFSPPALRERSSMTSAISPMLRLSLRTMRLRYVGSFMSQGTTGASTNRIPCSVENTPWPKASNTAATVGVSPRSVLKSCAKPARPMLSSLRAPGQVTEKKSMGGVAYETWFIL